MKFCYLINGYINIYFVYNTYTYFTMKIHFKNKWKNKQEILNGKSWFICLLQNRFSRTMHNLPSKQTLLRAQEQLLSLSKYLFSTIFLVLLLIYWRYFSNHLNLHMQLLISESCFFGKYCSIQALHKPLLQTEEYSTPVHKTIVWESTITLHFNWQKNYQGYFMLGSWNKPLINWCFSGYLFLYIQNTFPVFSFAWVMRVLRCALDITSTSLRYSENKERNEPLT